MKRPRLLQSATALAGVFLGVTAVGFAVAADNPVSGQAAPTLPVRARAPQLAADSASGSQATATNTVTLTAGTPSSTPTSGTPTVSATPTTSVTPSVTPTPSSTATITPTSSPTPTATATATGGACGGGTATITALDKVGEVVTLNASGNLTGWKLVSVAGSQTFNFPDGFVAGGTVQIKSNSPVFASTPSMLWWSTANLWNNSSNDDAQLFNCSGQLVQTFDDGD
ncbi:MAG: hypothetical protein ABI577_00175 [bacterium]